MSFIVREARPADAAAVAELNEAFNGVHESPDALAQRLADPGRAETALLAEVEAGQAAGFAGLRVTPSLFYATPRAELTELYVAPAFRRRGIARALIGLAERLALARGARSLVVLTGADNAAALRLYRAVGFEDDDVSLSKAFPAR